MQWDHPRLRGEYLVILNTKSCALGSPPLTRGIHSVDDGQQQPHGITPAYAGNTIVPGCFAVFRWDHPRLRGEYQVESDDRRTIQGSPPLTRGILSITMVPSACPRITPAYAGNTVCIDCIFRSIEDHPRLRGEYYSTIGVAIVTAGSPPLTRGIPKGTAAQNRDYGITPAYAGNTVTLLGECLRRQDHPRLRGEYFSALCILF